MRRPVLAARGLDAGYHGVPVVRGLSLEVHAGEVVVLLGPNGAGKTTTVNTLAGVMRHLAGDVEIDGVVVTTPLHRRVRAGLGLIPEDRSLVSSLTTSENLRLGAGPPARGLELFPELEALARRKAGLLSGGEQRMLMVARALAPEPRLILADELSLGLAPKIVARLLGTLRGAADRGAAVLLVEQHARQALAIADRVYILARGQAVWSGTATDARDRIDEIEDSYFGVRAEPLS